MRKNTLITTTVALIIAAATAQANTPRPPTGERQRVREISEPKLSFQSAPVGTSDPQSRDNERAQQLLLAEGLRLEFNIAAETPLTQALKTYAQTTNQQIIFTEDLVEGRRAPAVKGSYTAQAALEALLKDTGLIAEKSPSGALMIKKPGDARTTSLARDGRGAEAEGNLRLAQTEVAQAPSNEQGTAGANESNHDSASDDSSRKEIQDKLQEVVVTGTHLRGTNPTSPVIVLDLSYIERSGKTTVADVIRTLPQNFNGGGNVGSIGAGSANTNGTDASRINLRGLGSGATLVLVNGHRLAFSSSTGGPDISGIPLSAVESIDVLTDGASAIYGSDAVAGVVNIKLRRSFDGAETTAYAGDTTDGGGFQQRYAQLLGTSWSSGSALLNLEFAKDEEVDRRQRDFTRNLTDDDYSLQPELERRSVFASVSQTLTPQVTAHVDAMFSARDSDSIQSLTSAYRITNAVDVEQHLISAGLQIALPETWDLSLTFQHGEDTALVKGAISFPPDPTAFSFDPQEYTNTVRSAEVILSGTLFDLPAGAVRLATGGGSREFSIDINGEENDRSSSFGFAEIRVPLIDTLEGVIAARYEKFNDFDSTLDPKIGLSWRATEETTLRASWGTSFRAPELTQQHGPTSTDLRALGTPQGGRSTYILVASGNPDLAAETSTAWNLSMLYAPRWAQGFQLTLSAYQIKYDERIATPFSPPEVAIGDQQTYGQYFSFYPTQVQQDAAIALGTGPFFNFSGQPYDPNNVAFILDYRLKNLSRVKSRGLDVQLDYNRAVRKGEVFTFLTASLMEQKQTASPFVPTVETTGTVFNPPRYRARGGVTWTAGEIATTAVLNYLGNFDNDLSAVQNHVGSWLTLDAQMSYRPSWTGFGSGMRLSLSVQNLLNSDPPRVAADTFISSGDVGFDSTNASAVGRMIGIELRKSW